MTAGASGESGTAPWETASAAIARTLRAGGVTTGFGIVGDSNHHIGGRLLDAGIEMVVARHEGQATAMALGHALAGCGIGFASVHQGPGLTNALNGVIEAVKSRVPMVLLVGDTALGDVNSSFFLDQRAVVEAVGAHAVTIGDPATAAEDVAAALRLTVATSRPVVLAVPTTVQRAVAPAATPTHLPSPVPDLEPDPADPAELAALAAGLRAARRPLVLVGRGVWQAGVVDEALRLAELAGALTATTLLAKGSVADHPWHLGLCGGFASDAPMALVAEADLVLALGTSLTRWTTRQGALIGPGARVVRVDHDDRPAATTGLAAELVRADLRSALPALVQALQDGDGPGWRTAGTAERIRAARATRPPVSPASGRGIDPRTVTLRLDELLPAERTLVVDGGYFMTNPCALITVPDPAGFVLSSARYQSIGLGLGAAIGAAMARPDRLTVLCAGDAGFLMSATELETLARLQLPIVAAVFNDGQYAAEVNHFGPLGEDVRLSRYPRAPIAAMAAAVGIESARITSERDLAALPSWLGRGRPGPLVLDIEVPRDATSEFLRGARMATSTG